LAKVRADISDIVQSADMDRVSKPLTEALALLRTDAALAFLSFQGGSGDALADTSRRLHETIGRLDALLSRAAPDSGLSPSQSARLRTSLIELDGIFSHFLDLEVRVPVDAGQVDVIREA
jgi:hypothetical protein